METDSSENYKGSMFDTTSGSSVADCGMRLKRESKSSAMHNSSHEISFAMFTGENDEAVTDEVMLIETRDPPKNTSSVAMKLNDGAQNSELAQLASCSAVAYENDRAHSIGPTKSTSPVSAADKTYEVQSGELTQNASSAMVNYENNGVLNNELTKFASSVIVDESNGVQNNESTTSTPPSIIADTSNRAKSNKLTHQAPSELVADDSDEVQSNELTQNASVWGADDVSDETDRAHNILTQSAPSFVVAHENDGVQSNKLTQHSFSFMCNDENNGPQSNEPTDYEPNDTFASVERDIISAKTSEHMKTETRRPSGDESFLEIDQPSDNDAIEIKPITPASINQGELMPLSGENQGELIPLSGPSKRGLISISKFIPGEPTPIGDSNESMCYPVVANVKQENRTVEMVAIHTNNSNQLVSFATTNQEIDEDLPISKSELDIDGSSETVLQTENGFNPDIIKIVDNENTVLGVVNQSYNGEANYKSIKPERASKRTAAENAAAQMAADTRPSKRKRRAVGWEPLKIKKEGVKKAGRPKKIVAIDDDWTPTTAYKKRGSAPKKSPPKKICALETARNRHAAKRTKDADANIERSETNLKRDDDKVTRGYVGKNSGPFDCEICDRSFDLNRCLKRHMQVHSSERPHKCDLCEKSFKRRSNLTNHQKNVHNASYKRPTFECPICSKLCFSKNALQIHENGHTGVKPFKCETCGESFATNSRLKVHKFTIHEHPGQKPFPCHLCEKQYMQKHQLNMHLMWHDGIHPYVCDQCGKAFTQKRSIDKHLNMHNGIKPYVCHVCGKECYSQRSLKIHSRMHNDERKFKCTECGSTFKGREGLRKHIDNVHRHIKDYKCPECDKAFGRPEILRSHKLLHSGEKPYQCDVCSKSFRHAMTLRVHKYTHTGKKPFPCQMCDKGFSQRSHLNNHIETKHELVKNEELAGVLEEVTPAELEQSLTSC